VRSLSYAGQGAPWPGTGSNQFAVSYGGSVTVQFAGRAMIISALYTKLAAYSNRQLARRPREFSTKDKGLFRGQLSTAGDGKVHPQTCSIIVGSGSLLLCHVYLERDGASLKVGGNSFIGSSELIISTGITVGDNVLISNGCMIQYHDAYSRDASLRQGDLPAIVAGRP
jgi:hypothetical protein